MQTTELDGLVKSAQNGSREAFGQIVLRFQDMAFATAYALVGNPQLAEDAAQEAFLDAYQNLAKLRDTAAFPGWFRRIVVGRTHRQLRQTPRQFMPLEDMGALYAHAPDPATHLETWQLQYDVHHALETLSEAQRLVISLFYIEGYSYREIADYLEVPISTIKKRLFDARSKLKERMIHMVQNTLQQAKPSQSDSFSQAVQFFLALRDGDLTAIQELVAQNAALLTAKTEWRMALGHHYWPLGSTALHLAAGAGETDILAWLLAQNPNIQAQNVAGMTPLHIAAVMNQPEVAQLLLAHGANVNMTSAAQQTPLHHAALRNHLALVRLLMQHGADPTRRDKEGRTALDWATLRGNQHVIDALTNSASDHPVKVAVDSLPDSAANLLGRIIEGSGKVLDDGPPVAIPALHDAQHQTASGLPAMLPTGIK
ncbi:MAG: sigma-70 family RNA polymerase sigma factor, partial [Caldilineaceae bacterium]|nr:sigma-70 family RNA polymerase sigma factor [Caldilineaceae bacterium]